MRKKKAERPRDADFYLENMPIAFCAVEILTGERRPAGWTAAWSTAYTEPMPRLAGQPYGTLEWKAGAWR